MPERRDRSIARTLAGYAEPLTGDGDDYDEILLMAENARFVLIGEATHGTHEFYEIRAAITRRLITEQDFMAVAIEGDWPDAYRAHRYVMGDPGIDNAADALSAFQRFPLWMWRNTEVGNFIDWLYDYNHCTDETGPPVGFYGLDLYSLHASAREVVAYLETVDPGAAERARYRYGCLDAFGGDPQHYGRTAALGLNEACEQAVLTQLAELQARAYRYLRIDGEAAREAFFSAERNAELARTAEAYYRAMFRGRPSSWNIRDTHMADTLDALADHLSTLHGRPAKLVVWAHNSHVGDASATEAAERGEINLGQLVRMRHRHASLLIGFTTGRGTVSAAQDWDEPVERFHINPPLTGSVESVFEKTGIPAFMLNLRDQPGVRRLLEDSRLHRAIGVVYRPLSERWSHYYHTHLCHQFDAVIHLNETRALEPLEATPEWHVGEVAETYPSGL